MTMYNSDIAAGNVSPDTQKAIAIISHLGGVFFSWLVPLIAFLVYPPDRAPWLGRHSKEALNFQITLFIGYVIGGILTIILVGFVIIFALWLYSIIGAIMASVAASRGEDYRYPLSIRIL